jgi:hypothetical protein
MNQEAYQAPPPAFLRRVINDIKKEPEVKPNDKDKVMAELSQSDAWKVLKRYIETKQVMLAQQLRDATDNATMEEIGFRFMITDQINDFASKIVSFVEAPATAIRLKDERGTDSNRSGSDKNKTR